MNIKELSADCKAWRIERGITQTDIADKSGTSRQAVSQFENGEINSLRIYCAYLEMGYKSDWTRGTALIGGFGNAET